jgi:hypothetical protein
MALIREAVEDCAPPGSVPREGYLTPEFSAEAEAMVRGIYAIAGRCPPKKPRVKSEPGSPTTLGSSAAAGVRLIVWCRECGHQVEPDPAEQAKRHGAEMPVPEWRERLLCSKCGGRQIDMVVTGQRR